MKILFDHGLPFSFAHGGAQIQILQTKQALEAIGVEVEFLRWWDPEQTGDLVHFFGIPEPSYMAQTALKGIPVVLTNLFSATCNRPDSVLKLQGILTHLFQTLPGARSFLAKPAWATIQSCSHNIVGLQAERKVLEWVYRVPESKTSCLPLGLSKVFLNAGAGNRTNRHLITTGTISEQKNSMLLAQMAHKAQVPILFVGKPYSETSPFWSEFKSLVDGQWVSHLPHVESQEEMVGLLKDSRGFVLMSQFENWSLSAHEAAACGLPLLLRRQKWSTERFGQEASYFEGISLDEGAKTLREFHDRCPSMPPPNVELISWKMVATQLKGIYEAVLR